MMSDHPGILYPPFSVIGLQKHPNKMDTNRFAEKTHADTEKYGSDKADTCARKQAETDEKDPRCFS